MPHEITKHTAVLEALKSIEAIADLAATTGGQYDYEVDLEVIVYGRNYNGKKVGPYARLLDYSPGETILQEGAWGGNAFYFVVQGQAEVYVADAEGDAKVAYLPAGAQFGEMSVLTGGIHSATVRAPQHESVQVLEIRRPALRLLRKLPKFGERLDITYRRYARSVTLQDLTAAAQLSREVVKQLEAVAKFRVYSKRHILFRAGEPIERVYVIRTGWLRLSQQGTQLLDVSDEDTRDWDKTASEAYLGTSHCFGLEAITRDSVWTQTGVLLGRTEVLEISLARLRDQPELREPLLAALSPLAVTPDAAAQRLPLPIATAQKQLIDTGLVDGANLLLMDMDMCVRCGNCSMACHQVHGQSRLLRRGIHITRPVSLEKKAGKPAPAFQSLLHPSVCMHCKDPECLTGCPTGAISRFAGGQIDIHPQTCIGCSDCATQCPYNAISMTAREPQPAAPVSPRERLRNLFRLAPEPLPAPTTAPTGTGVELLAVKCNLCAGTGLNPPDAKTPAYSCEENCPTGALLRVNPHTYFAEIKQIEGTVFQNATHAIARHVSHQDRGKQLMHAIGLVTVAALTLLIVLGLRCYSHDLPLIAGWLGKWFNMRWLTGLTGLVGLFGVMAYPLRRRIYRRRAGPLRYWMLAHTYLGALAGIVLLLHGGARSGGLLTTALMVSFDLVLLTGVFGILCYFCAPRLLTKIESQPLLLDDLIARSAELADELRAARVAASDQARGLLEGQVFPHFLSIGYLLRQYRQRESLEAMTASAQSAFESATDELPPWEHEKFRQAIELAALSRRVDALIYLHQTLKLWVAPHVLATSLMLALMLVHIIQVIYFAVR
ncbi:MAG: cyclic nucleotide-binding domain-containing protein [Acidobacteria bacterium]|nr:cyclic nucleotide-binding domain-containing protein [Acidobacteriota bacterium]